jgi:GH15 family glucan-1,4-alpha-glucosidase
VALRIEDYALVGDTQTAALIGRDGSVDWLPFPRFDSGACFAALLGGRDNGRWSIAPRGEIVSSRRRYRRGTLVLETELETAAGAIRLIDFMPIRTRAPDLVRIVECTRGQVEVETDLVIRFDYGRTVPWVRRREDALTATAGPDALCLRSDVELRGEGLATRGDFTLREGEQRTFVCTWFPSHQRLPRPLNAHSALADTEAWWRAWEARCRYEGPARDAVVTSLAVLKALTYAPTGGMVAAATTSLPEWPGGVRNWDYRYCWLRDATLTLYALMVNGYTEEAIAWREWLLRSAAGDPDRLQIMYGVAGERRLDEHELPWLAGYEGSRPVRVGNAASGQLQLDVYGELIDSFYQARRFGIEPDPWAWRLESALVQALETRWREPDHGIWEVRGPARHFTHSKVMCWVAFDRAIKSIERLGLEGPIDRWRMVRDEIHAEVCRHGFDAARNTFTQSYDGPELDASLLLIPLVGFLPATDARVVGTVAEIERVLVRDGLVLRYLTHPRGQVDGLPEGEGFFLPCSFWLVDALVLQGRRDEAHRLFERLLALRNDVGLLSEEYDAEDKRLVGNLPQAFTHLALVNSAYNLAGLEGCPAHARGAVGAHPGAVGR